MESNKKLQAIVLHQANNASVHHIESKNKTQIASGKCKFASLTNDNTSMIYFFVINGFYYTLARQTTFAKIEYPETVSYIFPHWQSGICAISFHLPSEELATIEQILKNTVTLQTFQSTMDNPEFAKIIQLNCPEIQKNEISPPGKIKLALQKTSQYIGETLQAATNYFSNSSDKTEKIVKKQYQQGKKQIQKKSQQAKEKLDQSAKQISKRTNQNWDKIKEGTGHFVKVSQEYFDSIWNPVKETANQFTKKVQQTKEKQQNPNLAKAKQIARTSGQYVGEKIQEVKKTVANVGEKAKQIAGNVLGQSKENEQNTDNKQKEGKKQKSSSEQNPENATLI